MTVLVFGRTGQVCKELARAPPGAVLLGRDVADLTDPETCAAAIRDHAPAAVMNAAAYTAVDDAETDAAQAMRINADAPGAMARECAALGVPMVHISTDYVFDGGTGAPWRPSDAPAPVNAYGRSKLAGERAVQHSGALHAILRTSWVFSAHGTNFVRTMLRLSRDRPALGIVDDQRGGPTPAADIARACLCIAEALRTDPGKGGLYHYSGAPDVSWKAFAEVIFDMAGRDTAITGIETADWPTPARRPCDSRLDCSTTETAFGLPRPAWRAGLRDVLEQLGEVCR